MTTKANQNESATLKICEAVKKDGQPCKFKAKPNSCFCGVHKNYIDTSKPLFTEDIEEGEKLTLNFMTGENIKINKGYTIDYILQIICLKYPLDNYKYKYNIFKEGEEDKINNNYYKFNDDNYFCMPSQKFTYKEGDFINKYVIKYSIIGSNDVIITKEDPDDFLIKYPKCFRRYCYYIKKRTKCYITYHRSVYTATSGKWGWLHCQDWEDKVKISIDIHGNEYIKNNATILDAEKFKGE
jgi:hypothetical protein